MKPKSFQRQIDTDDESGLPNVPGNFPNINTAANAAAAEINDGLRGITGREWQRRRNC